ncbi:hypothetical protein GOBAR_AA15920 [Gossypium barbadense]|uniref:Transcription factor CBF/NF-Y/archaeal histone domain-containing protein n=1 Tax=Gossypium barbadense TaxID=3634 RepID=A0A2P5XN29_GOSBA|nr:hypothetical protein GOBAR_AA15920 [Gossypium barbadense]
MDQQGHGQPPAMGMMGSGGQVPYGTNPYQNQVTGTAPNPGSVVTSVGGIQSTNKRRTLQKNDIAAAITRTDIFDFLVDIVPREDLKDEVLASIPRGTMPVGGPADALSYYMPAQHAPQVGTPGMIMGKPVVDPAIYAQQSHPYMAQQMWPPGPEQQQSSSDH